MSEDEQQFDESQIHETLEKNSLEDNINEENFDETNTNDVEKGEAILDKPLLNTFFDTEEILLMIDKTYKGYQKENKQWVYKSRPISSTSFINKTINMLRSVINPQNFNAKMTPKQIDTILLEKNIEYIEMCRTTPEKILPTRNMEMCVGIFDHVLQTYFGIIEGGRISEILTQIATGNYDKKMFEDDKKKNFMSLFPKSLFRRNN